MRGFTRRLRPPIPSAAVDIPAGMVLRCPRPNKCASRMPIRTKRSKPSRRGRRHAFRIKTLSDVRWRVAGAHRPVRVIVISPLGYRLHKGGRVLYRKPAHLICTDPNQPIEQVLQAYLWRWGDRGQLPGPEDPPGRRAGARPPSDLRRARSCVGRGGLCAAAARGCANRATGDASPAGVAPTRPAPAAHHRSVDQSATCRTLGRLPTPRLLRLHVRPAPHPQRPETHPTPRIRRLLRSRRVTKEPNTRGTLRVPGHGAPCLSGREARGYSAALLAWCTGFALGDTWCSFSLGFLPLK
jgi:hypothetical protein